MIQIITILIITPFYTENMFQFHMLETKGLEFEISKGVGHLIH